MPIEDRLKDMLVVDLFVEVPRDDIRISDSLRDVLGVDSLGFVELREQICIEYGIEISDEEFTPENFSTIASLKKLIERHRQFA